MDIAEKRVYGERRGRTLVAVATDAGLAIVGVSGDAVGEFGLALRDPVRDLARIGPGRVALATEDDLLIVALAEGADAGVDELADRAATGFGPATAVGSDGGAIVAVDPDGTVRRTSVDGLVGEEIDDSGTPDDGSDDLEDGRNDVDAGGDLDVSWTELGTADVRAVDGRLLATPEGVLRAGGTGLQNVGLEGVRDVAEAGPLAATGDGCYRLGNGWLQDLEGSFDLVAAGSGIAHAAGDGDLYVRTDGEWTTTGWPLDAPPADVAYGLAGGDQATDNPSDERPATYAVAADGTFLVDGGDGWGRRALGLPEVRACAVALAGSKHGLGSRREGDT